MIWFIAPTRAEANDKWYTLSLAPSGLYRAIPAVRSAENQDGTMGNQQAAGHPCGESMRYISVAIVVHAGKKMWKLSRMQGDER